MKPISIVKPGSTGVQGVLVKPKKPAKDAARWFCPLGCGKSYRKSSSRSIQKHRITCFYNYMLVQTPRCLELFGDQLRSRILSNTGEIEAGKLTAEDLKNRKLQGGDNFTEVQKRVQQSSMVHYFCVGSRDGQIKATFRSPACRVDEPKLRFQCEQILFHARKSDTGMVQMMASNSEMIYYHQNATHRNRNLTFIVAVHSTYRGDPIVQVLKLTNHSCYLLVSYYVLSGFV
ncbi:hypothetical protein AAMO2058_000772000 [Amorphochlora amoebiformis]